MKQTLVLCRLQQIRYTYERFELLLADEIEFIDEEVKMFVTCIAMGFGSNRHKPVEVMDVDVNEDPEQSGQNLLAGRDKSLGEGYVVLGRKYCLVVDLALDPVH